MLTAITANWNFKIRKYNWRGWQLKSFSALVASMSEFTVNLMRPWLCSCIFTFQFAFGRFLVLLPMSRLEPLQLLSKWPCMAPLYFDPRPRDTIVVLRFVIVVFGAHICRRMKLIMVIYWATPDGSYYNLVFTSCRNHELADKPYKYAQVSSLSRPWWSRWSRHNALATGRCYTVPVPSNWQIPSWFRWNLIAPVFSIVRPWSMIFTSLCIEFVLHIVFSPKLMSIGVEC